MFSEKDLFDEVQAIVDANQCAIKTDWLANSVMSRHSDISGSDKDFYVLCAWAHVKTAVRAVVRRYRPEATEEPDRQIVLPGFDRLQVKYHVERNDESYLVPIDELTDQEIDAKAAEYERMAEGCRLHAAELRRYKRDRRAQDRGTSEAS